MEAIKQRKDGGPMATRACPDCGNPVSVKAPACPKCGRVLKKPPRQYGCVSGCFLIAMLGVVGVVILALTIPRAPHRPVSPPTTGGTGPPRSTTVTPPPRPSVPPTATSPARRAPATGEVAVVELPGGRGAWIATTDEAWDEMLDAQNARDMPRMGDLMAAGKVVRVLNGTRARVVESAALSRKVRVLDGPAAGEEGWIQAEFLQSP